MSARDLSQILGVDGASADKVVPLLEDAASALADVKVPTENEIHELASGAYKFTQTSSLESEDTDRRFEEAMKNLSKWRETAQVYLNGASVLLRRAKAGMTRYDSKKRVLAALRVAHPGTAPEHFYFTRETGGELPPNVPAALPKIKDTAMPSLDAKPEALNDEQRDLLVARLSVPRDPRSPDAGRIVALLAKCGDGIGPSVLRALAKPEETAKLASGHSSELLIGVRQLLPRLSETWCETLLRAALEAGWVEWIDRPLLDPPLPTALREKLQKEFGTRQDPRGNPYRPREAWFYNLDPS